MLWRVIVGPPCTDVVFAYAPHITLWRIPESVRWRFMTTSVRLSWRSYVPHMMLWRMPDNLCWFTDASARVSLGAPHDVVSDAGQLGLLHRSLHAWYYSCLRAPDCAIPLTGEGALACHLCVSFLSYWRPPEGVERL